METRTTIAIAMAKKDGHDWDKLSEEWRNSYLHNADTDIETRSAVPVIVDGVVVTAVCKRCNDQGYIDGKPCLECNPVGLPADVVHPHVKHEVVEEGKEPDGDPRLVNLCDSCQQALPSCEHDKIEFGDGVGNDNVISCDGFTPTKPKYLIVKPKQLPEARELVNSTRALNSNEYRCSKCSKPGKPIIHMLQKSGKGIGHKHQEFKVVDSNPGT